MTLLPSSLLGRTALIIGATLLLSQLAAFQLFQLFYRGPLIKQIADLAVSQIRTVGLAITKLSDDARDEFLDDLEEKEGIRVLFDNDSVLPSKLPEDAVLLKFADEVRNQLGNEIEFFVQPKSGRALWVKLPVGNEKAWIGIPRSQIELGFPWAWLAFGIGAALVALAAATWLVRRVNQPLRQLASAASVLGKGDYPDPINESGPSEVTQVARSFNQMLADVKSLDQERAILLAGISHDLRTPLARIRLATEMLTEHDDLRQSMAQDVEEMDAIVKQFLDFARISDQEAVTNIQLNEIVEDIADHYRQRGIEIKSALEMLDSIPLRVTSIRRALTNLVENALKYGHPPFAIATGTEGNYAYVSIQDHGPGIPEAERDRMLRPFTRLAEARSGPSGAGLGLAIVDRVAKIHGGRLALLSSASGGLDARIFLPLASLLLPKRG